MTNSGDVTKSGTLKFMAGLAAFTLLFVAASYFVAVVLTNYSSELFEGKKMIPVSADGAVPLLIIDPGHGGEDGGSSNGELLEKDINLSVSEDIFYLCAFCGIPAKMTRTADTALYDLYGDLSDYTGKRKAYDLKNRVRFVKEEGGGIYLGIHQNKFPDPRYHGMQVFYSPSDGRSEIFAELIKDEARKYLDPENRREVKRATSAIYVLDRQEIPAVLVECGFLSNPGEASLLASEGYRRRVALCVFSAATKFVSEGGGY